VIGTRSKTKRRPGSIQDRPLPDPRDRDQSGEGRDPDRANIYAEVLSMMMQNLTKPSSVPDRGRSRDRNAPRSRDNSQDRIRNISGSRQGRQPRRDGSWNRAGYNPANGPRDRLRTDRDRTPSRDRYGYRPTARSDQRQSNDYYQKDTYKKSNYSNSTRDVSREKRDRDNSFEAKRLARQGANSNAFRTRSNSQDENRNRSREKNIEKRDMSRDRSYENKRLQYQEDAVLKAYPNMRRGLNCNASYNPAISKSCSKCSLSSGHHEFACKKYSRYNYNKCSTCDKYHHYPSECKEVPKYPPKLAETNSTHCDEDDPN